MRSLLEVSFAFGLPGVLLAAGSTRLPVQKPAAAPAPPVVEYKIGERHILHSKILGEDRPYWVYLPESYGNRFFAPKRYPVLYLLDGDAHFHSASGVVQFMSEGINGNMQIPELIVVAIPNTSRTRDLTPTHTTRDASGKEEASLASSGGGEAFLDFLQKELIPHIESGYRTMPYRLLVGHSLGGLLTLDALLRQPPIFNGYIAIDPSLWWDQQVVLRRTEARLAKTNDFRGAVYISLANNPPTKDWDPKFHSNACRDFASLLQTNNSAVFRTTLQYFERENHGSVPLLSLYHGLLFIFDGYKPSGPVMDNPGSLTEHFARVSERLGAPFLPPEQAVNMYGNYTLYNEHDPRKAIEWFKVNASSHPDSFNAYDRLARAYEMAGEKDLALTSCMKVLELNRNLWRTEPDRWSSTVHALVEVLKVQSGQDDASKWLANWAEPERSAQATDESRVRLRGDVLARSGHWQAAVVEFTELIRIEPTNHQFYHALGPLLVAAGDMKSYRRHCVVELRRFGRTTDPHVAERMAKDCLFVPASGVDVAALDRWADTAVTQGSDSTDFAFFQFAKALASYRRGDFSGALDWTKKVIHQEGGVMFRDAQAYLLLAMTQHQLKQHEQARVSLGKAVEIIEKNFAKLEDGDLGDAWNDWIITQTLLKEAQALLPP